MELTREEVQELAEKWNAKEDVVLPDEIIDAYQTGKKTGVVKYAEDLEKKRQERLVAAMSASTAEIRYLEDKLNLEVYAAFLRQLMTDDECFHKTLIVIDNERYLDESVKGAYEELIKRSNELRESKNLILDFALLPNKNLNHDLLMGDGYQFNYVKTESRETQ